VFWLFLAVVLALSSILQLGHDMKTVTTMSPRTAEVQVSADHPSDTACVSHAGSAVASHCCAASNCVPAIIAPQARTFRIVAGLAERCDPDAGSFARAPSPHFHPPKLAVQA
jgi:hypothetical protein